jgi:hypothetical protein
VLVVTALLCGAVTTACVPHVSHSPRVEPGPRYFVNGSFVHVASLHRVRPDGSRAVDIYATAAVGRRRHFDDGRELFVSTGFVGDFMRRR